ncbi:hypothetical protein B0H11DRAFT_2251288 [Mycena galericulata]|nr:hypothetical protein B0H11DRAFT_2251288 [Mycena galericulata]
MSSRPRTSKRSLASAEQTEGHKRSKNTHIADNDITESSGTVESIEVAVPDNGTSADRDEPYLESGDDIGEDHVIVNESNTNTIALIDEPAASEAGHIEAAEVVEAPNVPSMIEHGITEAQAVKLLNAMGIEPGAVAGVKVRNLMAIYKSLQAADTEVAEQVSTEINGSVEEARMVAQPPEPSPSSAAETASTPRAIVVHVPTTEAEAVNVLDSISVGAHRVEGWKLQDMKLATFADPERAVFAITKLPGDVDWGLPTAFNNASNFLCGKGTSKPVSVWILGEVASTWWFDRDGFPAQRIALSVQPLCADTSAFCKAQLRNLCMPKTASVVANSFGTDQVKATRWMTSRGKKGEESRTSEFEELYDARTALKDKSLLTKLPVNDLKEHDIALMEARIGRYAVKASDSMKGKSRVMDRWEAFYDLQAVYLIKEAIDHVPTPVPVLDLEI